MLSLLLSQRVSSCEMTKHRLNDCLAIVQEQSHILRYFILRNGRSFRNIQLRCAGLI